MKRPLRAALIAILLFTGCSKPEASAPAKKPNILFILIDTLRADHLGYAGYSRDTSPNIDALSKKSVRFMNAYAASSWTAPCVASIFTGLPPSVHGMMPPNSRTKAADKFSFKLSGEIVTIADALQAAGYKTAAVTSNEWISEKFGYAQGFDYFFMKSRMAGDGVNEKAFRVIDKLYEPDKPFFLYVHYMDPHDPYKAPEPFRSYFKEPLEDPRYQPAERELMREYDNEIRYADAKIGELLEYAEQKGLLENAVVVLTADHGEQFRERGNVGHGYTLHDEETHIPLLIRDPAGRGSEITVPVSHLDIFPTLLSLTRTAPVPGLAGINLIGGDLQHRPIGVVAEVSRKYNFKSLVEPDRKKIIGEYPVGEGLYAAPHTETSLEVFDLVTDPYELKPTDLMKLPSDAGVRDYFGVLESLSKDLKRYKIDSMEMSDDTFEELKSLGYF